MSNTLPLGHFCAPSQCKPRSCNVQRLSSSDDWPCRRPRRSMGKRHVNMAGENAPRDRAVLKSLLVQAWRRLGPQARSSSVSSTLKHAITATLTGRAKPEERKRSQVSRTLRAKSMHSLASSGCLARPDKTTLRARTWSSGVTGVDLRAVQRHCTQSRALMSRRVTLLRMTDSASNFERKAASSSLERLGACGCCLCIRDRVTSAPYIFFSALLSFTFSF